MFAVGEPLSAGASVGSVEQPLLQTVADPWLRWLAFLGAAIVIGGLAFEVLIGVPVVYGPRARDSWQEMGSALSARWFRFATVGVVVLVGALLGQLLQQASVLTESSVFSPDVETLRSIAFESGWGRLWLYRLLAALGIGGPLFLAKRMSEAGDLEDDAEVGSGFGDTDDEGQNEDEDTDHATLTGDSIAAQAALVVGLVFLGLVAASSHNAASPADVKTLATVTDFAHLVASTIWIGGVFYLAISVPTLLRTHRDADTAGLLKAIIPRFTVLGLLSAGILVTTGSFSSYMQVTVPAAVANSLRLVPGRKNRPHRPVVRFRYVQRISTGEAIRVFDRRQGRSAVWAFPAGRSFVSCAGLRRGRVACQPGAGTPVCGSDRDRR